MLDTVLSARPDEFWVVALDIDPNDGAELIRKRADDHPDVSVLWVISPKELTDMLVADHGPDILTPPRAPIVVVNAEQSLAQLLPSGIKRADALNAAVDGAM